MPIILRNLRMKNCEICVDVGDHSNQGIEGKLVFEISGKEPIEKTVNLYYPPRTECCSPQKTGKIHTVTATLTVGDESVQMTKLLQFCS